MLSSYACGCGCYLQANDNGSPKALTTTCQLLITITDDNDNSPVFGQERYSANIVFEESKVGDTILNISATDRDDNDNGRFDFVMLGQDHQESLYFKVDGNGSISIKQIPPFAGVDTIVSFVEATDRCVRILAPCKPLRLTSPQDRKRCLPLPL